MAGQQGRIYFLMEKKMKKKALMSLVLLIIVGTSAVFAQSQGKYNLEIYNISETTYNTIDRLMNDPTQTREENYFLVRTANGTAVRSKDRGLSLEQAKQKLLDIDPRNTRWVNQVNSGIQAAQQQWGINGWAGNTSPSYRIYFWIRRTE
jgi:hypothetical protein